MTSDILRGGGRGLQALGLSEDSDGVWGPENGPGVQKCVDVAFLGSGRGGLYTGPIFRIRKWHFYIMES